MIVEGNGDACVACCEKASVCSSRHSQRGIISGSGLDLFWEPEKASVLYFLQNDQGAQKWPATDDVAALLLNCFDVDSCKDFEEEEVEYE